MSCNVELMSGKQEVFEKAVQELCRYELYPETILNFIRQEEDVQG